MCFTSRYIPQLGLPCPVPPVRSPSPLSWTTSLISRFPFIPSLANVKLTPTTLATLPISSAHNLPLPPFTNLLPIPQNYQRLSPYRQILLPYTGHLRMAHPLTILPYLL